MKTILQTPRVLLREFVSEDVDALAKILSDPVTMRHYPVPFDRAGVEQWISRSQQRYRDDGVGLWAMESLKTREVIGDCGIIVQHVDDECSTKSDTTCAATFGDKASLPKPPSLAAIGASRT